MRRDGPAMTEDASQRAPLPRHVQFYISALVGAAALLAAFWLKAPLAYSIGANAFFVAYIAIVLWQMPRLSADYLSRHAQATDQPVWIIFLVTLGIIAVATGSLFQLINGNHTAEPASLAFSFASVPLGWFTLQAMTALHYAHLYWTGGQASRPGRKAPAGGLGFPGKDRPEGWDFLYYATTIGMTFQTSDTEVSSTAMRGMTLLHAIVSFFFNTVILAAAVNLAVSLGS